MSSRDRPRDDDLEERLDELEDVLAELRRDLKRDARDRPTRNRRTRPRSTDRRDPPLPPRPPRFSELLRFTEQYTIPTLIALLETTIKSLELLRGTLRLADPGRGLDLDDRSGDAVDRLADVRDGASAGLARSLSELRTALSEADLPEDAASRSIIEDARDLTAEIEARIEEGRRTADRARDGRDGRDGRNGRDRRFDRSDRPDRGDRRGGEDDVVRIDVLDPDEERDRADESDPDDGGDAETTADPEPKPDPTPEVDVESELESIKRQLGRDDEHEAGDADGTDDGDTEGDGASEDDGDSAGGDDGDSVGGDDSDSAEKDDNDSAEKDDSKDNVNGVDHAPNGSAEHSDATTDDDETPSSTDTR
ncbi:DUF7547 family protein [Halorubrum vacuolatum]|uniref:Uncharacterized protein n=1 Tax=Halorubrum vacuolatum TaxID=63740 RepID=A0A238VTN9_HALVU|nr:hypothetical protein [Halorubrum vacuolatum]SNR37153.1 hypothetical protein SAMN06264855_1046 [Halorubrum vacuolatum]